MIADKEMIFTFKFSGPKTSLNVAKTIVFFPTPGGPSNIKWLNWCALTYKIKQKKEIFISN